MNAYFAANRLSQDEKNDILSQHRTLYDGYRTLQPNVSNEQPLYVQDFAKDKVGAVLNNKGNVKPYTNVGINEQKEQKEVCDECGSMMMEGECMECGWKGEVGAMEETEKMMCECGGEMREGECMECGYKMEELDESGHLSDIYNVEDLGNAEFDYVQGGGNKYGTFEKMHHMKGIKNEQVEDDYVDNFEDPDNEDDADVGTDDLEIDSSEMYEQGYTGGGNAPDMDISNVKPAYDFVSDGPMDVYPEGEMEEDECLDCDEETEYETMESAWSEDMEEQTDVSGVQGIYGDMDPAYDFDSEGPGSAGPYQTRNEGETEEQYLPMDVWDDAHKKGHVKTHKELGIDSDDDFDEDELEVDFDDFDPRDKSWEEIKAHTGDWEEIDEDLQESFQIQKNKITEMMIRMKIIK
jgi:hypothetical protein